MNEIHDPMMPRPVRDFITGIDAILDAYRSGDLSYTVLVADKPAAHA